MAKQLALFLLILCSAIPMALQSQTIGAEVFFRFNELDSIKLSPDGRHLAITFQKEENGILQIVNLDSRENVAMFTTRQRHGIDTFFWANDERIVFTTHQLFGGLDTPMLNGDIYALNIDNTRKFQLAGPGVGDNGVFMVENPLPDADGRIRVLKYEVRRRSVARSRPVSYLLDIYAPPPSGSVRLSNLMSETNGPLPWGSLYSDRNGVVRLAVATSDQMHVDVRYRNSSSADWLDISHDLSSSTPYGFSFLGFSADGSSFYYLQYTEAGTIGLFQYLPEQHSSTVVFSHPQFDIQASDIVFSNQRDAVIGVKFSGFALEQHYFGEHPDIELQRNIDAAFPGERIVLTSVSRDGNRAVAAVTGPQRVGDYYLLDTRRMEMVYLGGLNAGLDPAQMAAVTPFAVRSQDGLVLGGYVTKPSAANTPLPMVVIPHGGPIGVKDSHLFNREAQFFAHHGYAVLQLNFRGSGGFGRDHLAKGFGSWGTGMIDDLELAVRWAVRAGHADAGRVCIYGGSYGGFAALASAARHPDTYRCAAGYAGVYDLAELSRSDIPFLPGGREYIETVAGSDPAELARQSPVNAADAITIPVFLAHGGSDRRAPIEQAEAMREALEQAGNPPHWLLRETEGHGFYEQGNRVEFYQQLLEFISRNIGPASALIGRSEPAQRTGTP